MYDRAGPSSSNGAKKFVPVPPRLVPQSQSVVRLACIVAWFVLNMTIANLNKWIFHRYSFRYPALLTDLHMLASFVLGRIALSFFMGSKAAPSRSTRRSVALLSLVFVVSVASGNAALRYIHISFAQSIGATAPLWTVLLSKLITGQSYGAMVYAALSLVSRQPVPVYTLLPQRSELPPAITVASATAYRPTYIQL